MKTGRDRGDSGGGAAVTTRLLFFAGVFGCFLSNGAGLEGVQPLQVRERIAPWGTVVERVSYYLKDGKEVEHGEQESFSPDGSIQSRGRYVHGKMDGPYVLYYDGAGRKETEVSYVAGLEHGPFRTWSPDGELLFEGTWNNGKMWDGWFDQSSTSSNGVFHRKEESWKIAQWKDGKKVPKSTRVVKSSWRSWTPGRLPDQKMFIRWNWSQFERKSTYPHLDRMPAYQNVPFLIECIEQKGGRYQEASDQLEALTRMQFGNPWLQSDPERIAAVAKWRQWWEDVGKHRPETQIQNGVRDAGAWDLAKRGRNLPMPDEPLVIPETYVLKVRFRAGDYDGVTSETLTLQRNQHGAELIRSFSTRRDGPVTEDVWLPFGVGDADRVVRALGYLIDRPWLLNDETEIEKRYWASEKKNPGSESLGTWCDDKLKGRESYGAPYYPNVEFELRDGAGKLWWNADPDQWYGANPDRFNKSHQPVPGTVFPFLAAHYPESARRNDTGKPGWGAR
jgi:hypothetical protein